MAWHVETWEDVGRDERRERKRCRVVSFDSALGPRFG